MAVQVAVCLWILARCIREAQAAIAPATALEMLKQGNERFVNGNSTERDYLAQIKQTTTGQFPVAAVVGWLDSRIPPAIVFDRGIGICSWRAWPATS